MTSTDHPVALSDPTVEMPAQRSCRRWSRGRKAAVSAALLLVVLAGLLVATVAPSAAPPDRPQEQVASERSRTTDRTRAGGSSPAGEEAASESTTTTAGVSKLASSKRVATGNTPSPAPGGPVLVVESDLYPEPGDNGALFFITNAGGSPLEWSWVPDDSPEPVVQPESGTVAPGESQLVSFELFSQNLDFVYPLSFESNGGTADMRVHLTALDPVFEIVDGTWVIRNGNSFIVSHGDMDLGLKLKNVGSEPLYVEPQQVDGLAVIGGPWTLEPGEQVHLHLVLCNAAYSGGIPDFHDRDLHIHTDGWQGTLDFGVRFTLSAGQAALPC